MDQDQEQRSQRLRKFLATMQQLMDKVYTALARQDLSELQRNAADMRTAATIAGEVLVQIQAQLLAKAAEAPHRIKDYGGG